MDQLSAFLHTPAWERFQRAIDAPVQRYADELYIQHSIPRGHYWQSSRCAISTKWEIPDFAKQAWFLRLDPDMQTSSENLEKYAKDHSLPLLSTTAFQPRQTSVVTLDDEETVLSRMKAKFRYNMRVAEKHEVIIELHHTNVLEQYPRFWKLLSETAERQNFRTHGKAYYESMIRELEKDGMVHMGISTIDGEDLAIILVITCGNVATYLHSASSLVRRETKSLNLLHWNMIKWAMENGITLYDLWGTHAVQDENGEWNEIKDHASAGTTYFKLGFGGTIHEYPGTYDLVLRKIPYTLYTKVRAIRSRKRAFQ